MKPCCEQNLGEPETPNPDQPDLTVRKCLVCGANHFQLLLDPLELNLTGKEL